MMSKRFSIFISYERKNDAAFARNLREHLTTNHLSVFMDETLEPGDMIDEKIEKAIIDSLAFVVVCSTAARQSLYVHGELNIAIERYKKKQILIIPALRDEGGKFIATRGLRYVDFTGDPQEGFDEVLKRVKKLSHFPSPESLLPLIKELQDLTTQQVWGNLSLDQFDIDAKTSVRSSPLGIFREEIERNESDGEIEPRSLEAFITSYFRRDWSTLGDETLIKRDSPGAEKPLSMLLITGEAGIGKTTALKKMAASWAREEREFLGIYINLTDLIHDSEGGFRDRLKFYLLKKYKFNLDDLIDFLEEADQRAVLFLDGFDEAALKPGESRHGILALITAFCAEQGLFAIKNESEPEYEYRITGVVVATRHHITYSEKQLLMPVTIVQLEPFDSSDLAVWLDKFNTVAKSPDRLEASDFLDQSDNKQYWRLWPVVKTPLFLYFLAAVNTRRGRVREIVTLMQTRSDEERTIRFLLVNRFLEFVTNGFFVRVGAFHASGYDCAEDTDPEYPAREENREREALHYLADLAEDAVISGARQVPIEDKEKMSWLCRALPMEVVEADKDILRFPHLTIVEYLMAKKIELRILRALRENESQEGLSFNYRPSILWEGIPPKIRELTLDISRLPISDRIFEYLDQHLESKKAEDASDITIRKIYEIAKYWEALDAVILPKFDARSGNDRLVEESDDYYICGRQFDRGLAIAYIGLPLKLLCEQLLHERNPIGGERQKRYRLRQYLHLSSYYLDNAPPQQTNLRRLPLRWLRSEDCSLDGADMIELVLEECDFSKSMLQGANLLGAILNRADLHIDCDLRGATLASAELRRANMIGLTLDSVNLFGANLEEAHLEAATLRWCNLTKVSLKRAYLNRLETNGQRTQVIGCTMIGTNLFGAHLEGAQFIGCTLIDVNFHGADLQKTEFKDTAILKPRHFEEIKSVEGAVFDGIIGLSPGQAGMLKRRQAEGSLDVTEQEPLESWLKKRERTKAKEERDEA